MIPDAELPQQARTIEGADEIPEKDACAVLSQQLAASRKHFLSCLTRYSAPEYDFCFPESRRSIYVFSTFREVSKGMQATMEKKRLEQFRKQLEQRQQELRRVVSRTQEDGRIADAEAAQDIADRAANSYTKEFLFAQSNNDRQLLGMVEMALSRIREGSFGECINCGNEINAKRLEAVPWTRYCIECQEKMEKGQLEESHT